MGKLTSRILTGIDLSVNQQQMLKKGKQFMVMSSTVTNIATSLGLTENELFQQALTSFLREKKRQTLQLQLETLARYDVTSPAELESKIAEGSIAEHPAWEDLIVAENLSARITELNAYLDNLQQA